MAGAAPKLKAGALAREAVLLAGVGSVTVEETVTVVVAETVPVEETVTVSLTPPNLRRPHISVYALLCFPLTVKKEESCSIVIILYNQI